LVRASSSSGILCYLVASGVLGGVLVLLLRVTAARSEVSASSDAR
jgi:hypothetical protein